MIFERANTGYFIAFVLLGAVLGSALGNLIVKFIPALKEITTSLTGPIGFNLEIITFSIKLNFASIVGLILGIFIFRKV
ncbi:MAG: hypothetical protein CVV49_14860 [Spirochaetae bacterium HGW-Spirochaetae-5]|nr:MAG: hypothetical protein CVV49_14860 [Spirochaetae bacterium HGW-Spirochaetae-5]